VTKAPCVIDASALLALVFGEHLSVGREAFENGILSTVNLAEVISKMVDVGAAANDAMADIEAMGLNLTILDFDRPAAVSAADLRARTKPFGLSLGDRACLVAALSRDLAALTADRAWMKLEGFTIITVR
jgi:ribonuclease VapC